MIVTGFEKKKLVKLAKASGMKTESVEERIGPVMEPVRKFK
jgi:hypothetical protein